MAGQQEKKATDRPENDRPDSVRVTAGKCARCGKPVVARYRPFCSERCSDLDLAGWLSGSYRIPTEEAPDGTAIDPAEEDNESL